MVAMVISVVLSVLLSGNFGKDVEVVVIDLDNSAYSRDLTNRIDASEYMQVTAVLNTPVDPKELMYRDQAYAVVYFPQGLEKDRYTGVETNIGVFYDTTNPATTSNIKVALNEIVGMDNAVAMGDTGSTNDTLMGSLSLADRILFNPQESTSNATTMNFLFFFGAMFFTFATIGMIPRLRLTGQLDKTLRHALGSHPALAALCRLPDCFLGSGTGGAASLGRFEFLRPSGDFPLLGNLRSHGGGHAEPPVRLDGGQPGHCLLPHDTLHTRRLHPGRPHGAGDILPGLGGDYQPCVPPDLGVPLHQGHHFPGSGAFGYYSGDWCLHALHGLRAPAVLLALLQRQKISSEAAGECRRASA